MLGSDDARHLLGGYASIEAAQHQDHVWTGLGNSALWIHQRQDVYNAILNQRLPRTDPDKCGIDRSMSPADDCIWAKRASCLASEVVSFCFGPDVASVEKYQCVSRRLDEWAMHRPDTFNPVYYAEADPSSGRFFPELCLLIEPCGRFQTISQDHACRRMLTTELVHGFAYFQLALLLMAVYDPTRPKIGPRYVEMREQTKVRPTVDLCFLRLTQVRKAHVLQHLRILCGIAICNQVPPARNVACLAISQCECSTE